MRRATSSAPFFVPGGDVRETGRLSREQNIIERMLVHTGQMGWRLFRNSVGLAWRGRVTESYDLNDRSRSYRIVELSNARPIRYGLCPGSSPLIGLRTVKVTPEMVGKRIAQFCAIETCGQILERLPDERRRFLHLVRKAGGYGAIARMRNGELELDDGSSYNF